MFDLTNACKNKRRHNSWPNYYIELLHTYLCCAPKFECVVIAVEIKKDFLLFCSRFFSSFPFFIVFFLNSLNFSLGSFHSSFDCSNANVRIFRFVQSSFMQWNVVRVSIIVCRKSMTNIYSHLLSL